MDILRGAYDILSDENKEIVYAIHREKDIDKEEIVLFISFDLVNSSRFKTANINNWFDVIYTVLDKIRTNMFSEIDGVELWRTIGDEIVFVLNITSREQLKQTIQEVFIILNEVHENLKNGNIFNDGQFSNEEIEYMIEQNILGIKAAAWIALVSKRTPSRKKMRRNIKYIFTTSQTEKKPLTEFQGNDIDIGFRVSRYNTRSRRLALSVELAYILSEDASINPKLHIISYNKLKGVWDQRIYPVIWYHDEYIAKCKLEKSFYYDEDEDDEIIEDYFKKIESNKIRYKDLEYINTKLNNIAENVNIIRKIENIKSILDINSQKSNVLFHQNEANTMLEIHCVAVCYNKEKDRILMFKRKADRTQFANMWDFGCSKMTSGISFKEQLKKAYKNFANIDIKVYDPFKEYTFNRECSLIISGIRFYAEIENDKNISFDLSDKYCDIKYINLEEFKEVVDKDSYIDYPQFLEVFEIIHERTQSDKGEN